MSPLAFYRDLLAKGVPEDVAYDLAAKFETDREAEARAREAELLDRLAVDLKSEERKAKDRARKAAAKAGIPRNSTETAENAEFHATPPSPSFPPQTPPNHPHPPGDINTRARPSSIAKPNGFARFWEAYPNKTGKLAAEKAFARAVAKIASPDPLAVLLAGVERSRSSREWREGYVPHPTTWLNQGRWDDQPAEIIHLQPQGRTNERANPDPRQSARTDRLGRSLAGLMAAVDERTAGLD